MPDGAYSRGTFEDQIEEFSGQNTFEEYTFEVPFDCVLIRASVGTKSATAVAQDAYVTIKKNLVTDVVAAGPVGNRTLKVKTNFLNGVDLANIPCMKGDKLTVRLNIETLNTVSRAKVVIAHASLALKMQISPYFEYGGSGPHP